jgi:hypothetical protein
VSIYIETSGLQLMKDTEILPLPMYVTTVPPELPSAEELTLWSDMDAVYRSLACEDSSASREEISAQWQGNAPRGR